MNDAQSAAASGAPVQVFLNCEAIALQSERVEPMVIPEVYTKPRFVKRIAEKRVPFNLI